MKTARDWAGMTGIVVAAIGLGTSLTASAADESGAGERVVVRYDDLDLSRDAGVEALYGRLVMAAKRACGSYDAHLARERLAWRECFDTALEGAVAQFDSIRLAALHDSNVAPALPARVGVRPAG
jgi:UrcA family protein